MRTARRGHGVADAKGSGKGDGAAKLASGVGCGGRQGWPWEMARIAGGGNG